MNEPERESASADAGRLEATVRPHRVQVQACRPEDRAMLATPEGAELLACVAAALAGPTPGPWTLYRSERFPEYYVNQQGGPGYVCTMPLYEHRLPECEANARLVEAAPELLDALAALVDRCAFDGVPNDSAPTWHRAMVLVRRLKHGA